MKMNKRLLSLLLMACLLFSFSLTAYAEGTAHEINGGTVSFNGKKLITNFSAENFTGAAKSLLPGETGKIELSLTNNDTKATDWWMKNTILDNFLASEAGGAYTYKLRYIGSDGSENPLYDNDRVGGDIIGSGLKEGLEGINDSLKDYLFLGTLKPGKTGTVELEITLDGETNGVSYMNELANLELRFAVERTLDKSIVKTGDETDPLPYLRATAISGAAFLVLAFVSLELDRRKKGAAK